MLNCEVKKPGVGSTLAAANHLGCTACAQLDQTLGSVPSQMRVRERGSELQSRKELTQPSVFGSRVIC